MRIENLEVQLCLSGVEFVHACPTQKACDAARERFLAAFLAAGEARDLTPDRESFSFIVAKLSGCSVLHVPVLVLEDWDKMDKIAREELLCVPASMPGRDGAWHQAMTIRVHT